MTRKVVLIYTIFLLCTLGISTQTTASIASNYVIFRANISPLYIENESVIIQVVAIPFSNNKPIGESCTVHVSMRGINVNYSFVQDYTVRAGKSETLYLPALREGHYDITLYASWNGILSKVVDQDFGVTKAPIPYSLSFTDDGSKIIFTSLKLNDTGQPDPRYPFRLEIYQYTHGAGESLVMTYTNVTNITITVPESWKNGILYVEVVDIYGWRNSATINLAAMQFQGIPLSYDYDYAQREPFRSREPAYIVLSLALIFVAVIALGRWKDAR